MGARIPAGATRATEATGREAVAVAEADVAALLANGARRRLRAVSQLSRFLADVHTLTRFRNVSPPY